MVASTTPTGRARFSISPRVSRALNIASLGLIVVLLAAAILWRIPSNYMLQLPATAETVDPKLYVAGHPAPSGRGKLFMTFVAERQASLLERIFAGLDPDATLQELPKGYSQRANDQQMAADMLDSTQKAELAALCWKGYKALCGGGVRVAYIEKTSKAAALLQVGDIIVRVDGQAVVTPDGLRAALGRKLVAGAWVPRRPGDRLTLVLLRAGAKGRNAITLKDVPTSASPDSPPRPILGIIPEVAPPLSLPRTLPVEIKINAGDIGGPSAGLMFTLGILNRLSTTDLTHGNCVAGTGTIDLDGSVGPIGGVKQKVIGAEWAHARYFLVPEAGGNYDDALRQAGSGIVVHKVNTLQDALSFLAGLPRGTGGC